MRLALAAVLVAAAAALAACAAPPSPAARAARADTLAIRRAISLRQPDSVVSLQISGDTARVEISQPMFFVLVRLRGDWIPRSVLPLYDGPAPGAFVDGPPLVPDTATRHGSQSITTMPIYPGDTRAQ